MAVNEKNNSGVDKIIADIIDLITHPNNNPLIAKKNLNEKLAEYHRWCLKQFIIHENLNKKMQMDNLEEEYNRKLESDLAERNQSRRLREQEIDENAQRKRILELTKIHNVKDYIKEILDKFKSEFKKHFLKWLDILKDLPDLKVTIGNIEIIVNMGKLSNHLQSIIEKRLSNSNYSIKEIQESVNYGIKDFLEKTHPKLNKNELAQLVKYTKDYIDINSNKHNYTSFTEISNKIDYANIADFHLNLITADFEAARAKDQESRRSREATIITKTSYSSITDKLNNELIKNPSAFKSGSIKPDDQLAGLNIAENIARLERQEKRKHPIIKSPRENAENTYMKIDKQQSSDSNKKNKDDKADIESQIKMNDNMREPSAPDEPPPPCNPEAKVEENDAPEFEKSDKDHIPKI